MESLKTTEKKCDIFSLDILNSFPAFFFDVFSYAVKKSEGAFKPSKHIIEWCLLMQGYEKTAIESARYHLKTTIALGYLAWKLARMENDYNEWLFIAYKADLGAYHLKRLKRYISYLPEIYKDYQNITQAEGILHYISPKGEFVCEPEGIMSFKRGRHPDGIICDDILKDPQVKLDISQLEKIERAFIEEVMPMPKEELHVFGTPQDKQDLFSRIEKMPDFQFRKYRAIVNETRKEVLWKEKFPYEKLAALRLAMGEKSFNKEFQCAPVRGAEAFLDDRQLEKITIPRLKNYDLSRKINLNEYAYAGFDIGKKSHPSHLSVFGVWKKKLIQLHSKWMDGWDYIEQIEYLRRAIDVFSIGRMLYDDTRAEFEGFKEAGTLPEGMEGVAFTAKNKYTMATDFDAMVTREDIYLLADERQTSQLLNVDNDLRAVSTAEGHGDCFFSICLAIKAYLGGQGIKIWGI